MGVPSFFRWLVKKYPKVVSDAKEVPRDDFPSDEQMHAEWCKPNPNGFETDCLYLDMNGIIHPCCHPEDSEAPADEGEMIKKIFEYIDRIFGMVRPRRVLYMAIDGVAPRAKMNQQRSRRFRAAKELNDKEVLEERIRNEWALQGRSLPPRKRRPWDSNVITPGTPFMDNLSKALHWYIADRIDKNPAFRDIVVIFSDAKVPGEGEHKIMKFIRNQRAQPGYDANTRHCLYGMDADLIMLGLASHDPHFRIIREEVTTVYTRKCDLCGQEGHIMSECTGEAAKKTEVNDAKDSGAGQLKPFQFLHLSVLREYLAHDLFVPNLPFEWDLENAIDDFVLLAITVGNDFLPHLPSLEIREQALERLISIWRRLLPSLGGYISGSSGNIDFSRLDVLFSDLGQVEDAILKQRKRNETFQKKRNDDRQARVDAEKARRAAIQTTMLEHADQQGMVALGRKRKQPDAIEQPVPDIKVESHVDSPPSEEAEDADVDDSKAEKKKKKKKKKKTEVDDNENVDMQDAVEDSVKAEKKKSKKKKKEKAADGNIDNELVDDQTHLQVPVVKKEESIKKKRKISSTEAEVSEPVDEPSVKVQHKKSKKEVKVESPVSDLGSDSEDDVVVAPSPFKETRNLTKKILEQHKPTDEIPDEAFAAVLNTRLAEIAEPAAEEDQVRFGEEGWKDRYYQIKMRLDVSKEADQPLLKKLFQSYAQGLAWVMKYYYAECPDWGWFYPFHYAPFAGDLQNLDKFDLSFNSEAKPFTPIGQLMGVLPAASAHAVPEACRRLMTDSESTLADFYPSDFPLDLNGKRYLWQAVALLPWIDEKRLLRELHKVEKSFSPTEKQRNSLGSDYMFVNKINASLTNTLAAQFLKFVSKFVDKTKKKNMNGSQMNEKVELDLKLASSAHKVEWREHEQMLVWCPSSKQPYEPHLSGQVSRCERCHERQSLPVNKGSAKHMLIPFFGSYHLCVDCIVPHTAVTVSSALGLEPIPKKHGVYSAVYKLAPDAPHVSKLLPDLKMPTPMLNERDFINRTQPRFGEGPSFYQQNNNYQGPQGPLRFTQNVSQANGASGVVDAYGASGHFTMTRHQAGGVQYQGYSSAPQYNPAQPQFYPPPPPPPMPTGSHQYGQYMQYQPPQYGQPQNQQRPTAPIGQQYYANPYASLAYGLPQPPPPPTAPGGQLPQPPQPPRPQPFSHQR